VATGPKTWVGSGVLVDVTSGVAVLVGVLEGIREGVDVGSIVLPGVGVIVGNISTAPTQDEMIAPVRKISIIDSGNLVMINLIEF
jgi:hypothetical protein